MKPFYFLFILSVVLVTPAVAQQDWGCGGPCSTYDALNQQNTYDPMGSYRSLPSVPYQHDLNPGGWDLTDRQSSGADYWYEDRTTRDIYSDPPRNSYQDQKSKGCGWTFGEWSEGC